MKEQKKRSHILPNVLRSSVEKLIQENLVNLTSGQSDQIYSLLL